MNLEGVNAVGMQGDLETHSAIKEKYSPSNTQPHFRPPINKEARGRHRHDLDIPNPQTHPEAPQPPLCPNPPHRLRHTQSMSIPHRTTNLHPPPDNLKRIRCRLADQPGKATTQ